MSNVLNIIRKFAKPVSIDDYEPINENAKKLKAREIPYSSFVECNKIIEPEIVENKKIANLSTEAMLNDHEKVKSYELKN